MKKTSLALMLSVVAGISACNEQASNVETGKVSLVYPTTNKVEQSDNYHGILVSDPYRWLEDDTAAAVKGWVEDQNKVTFNYLENIPFRNRIKERLTEIFDYPKYGSPYRAGEYYFFSKNDGLQNQSVTYFQKGMDGEPQVFLDPNKLSEDGTVTASLGDFSKDKKYVTRRISRSGSDWTEIDIMEVATKRELTDKLEWVKFSGTAWKGDGFYYSRYDAPAKGKEYSNKNEYHKIYFHKLGDPQSKDQLIFEDKEHPLRYFYAGTTEDERFLIVSASEGTHGNEIYVQDLQSGQKGLKKLFPGFKNNYSVVDNVGDKLLVYTDNGAPNYRLVLVDPNNPAETNWKDVIAEKPELLRGVTSAGGKLFANYLKDVTSRIYQMDINGKVEREVSLPALGSAGGFYGDKDETTLFYSFTSFTYPSSIYKYDIASGKSEVFRQSEVKFNPADYETKQVFYPSKDGTKVPMFIVHKKGLKLDGTNPTLLYGYGGFNISLTPSFSTSNVVLLENGGIYALANLRGGGEYGEEWHKAGMLEKKQNVFDDFIAAGEYLVKEKYTSPEKLAIAGGSNGGLLVGAAMTQRPDLFKVAFPAVGVLDMLRFHKFTVGWGWVVEYGSSENPDQFKTLMAYSPLHNLKDSTAYPATMITTADHDDRVVPAHSFKFAAALQEKHRGDNPVLIRIESKAGHGAGKPTSKVIEAEADKWAFMFYNMQVEPKTPSLGRKL